MCRIHTASVQILISLLVFLATLLLSQPGLADWINLTGAETSPNIAEITVHDDHIEVKLEIYINDLKHYRELIPNHLLKKQTEQRKSEAERMAIFARSKFSMITDSGEYLPAQLKLVEPRLRQERFSAFTGKINPITGQKAPEAPTDKRVLYAEIIYPFPQKKSIQKPETITIIPPSDEKGFPLTTIGFVTYHKSVPVIDFRYLKKTTLHLNWDDPWYSKFDNPNLKRHHKDAMMSYLYIEDYEVRHEVLLRIKDMANWMDLKLTNPDFIDLDELDALKKRMAEFLVTKNIVTIDGNQPQPIIDQINYVTVGLQGIKIIEKPQRLDTNTAILGIIFTYLIDALPQKVHVDWELFNDQIQRVPTSATDPAGPLSSYVTPEHPRHEWTNFLKNYQAPQVAAIVIDKSLAEMKIPVISLLLLLITTTVFWVGVKRQRSGFGTHYHWLAILLLGTLVFIARPYGNMNMAQPVSMTDDLSTEQATKLMQSLLKNVYRAFDFREENSIYDKLAVSVEGDLLANIYLHNRQSFSVQQAGGAQAKVKKVEISSVQPTRIPGGELSYIMHTQWLASGLVGHWGHTHLRQNYYNADITIIAIDGQWKITGLDLIEEQRIDPSKPFFKQEIQPEKG